jgi:cytidylate kinase
MPHVIAIDGPAGAGKSTVARELARRLGWRYLDTGALYRAVALAAEQAGIANDAGAQLAALAMKLDLHQDASGRTFIGPSDVSQMIRTESVTRSASAVSALPEVRAALLQVQRSAGARENLVCEGRDMASVVFPEASLKIFLDAREEVRAERRTKELAAKDGTADASQVRADMHTRDHADSTRATAPLTRTAGHIHLDTSHLAVEDVLATIEQLVKERLFHQPAR